ncbi:MAG: glycosyltransferase, partial [Chthoniobacterales bacterium]|nr:glycosyltransferase [Chthoniobacterales bacterium]
MSVILPAYNRRATIERAIRSVFEQGLENIEILVADDASTDGTAEVAARMDSRVCVLRLPENSGPASARNVALQRATGKYVAFLDSDDEWLSGKLDRQIGFLERNSRFGLCATSCKFILSDGRTIERIVKNSTDWRRVLHSSQPFHGASTTVAPRWILKTVGYQDESLRVLEDWDWCLRIAIHHPIHVIEEPLANIYENQPTNPFLTFEATRRFLKKH